VESIFRRNPTWANEILDRCRDRKRLTDDKDVARAQRKMQSAQVASLDDATGKDRSKCILFIAEGDSAIGGISDVRDPKVHGGIKLTGKIMNVYGIRPKKVVENKVLSDIMTSIGLVIGQRAKIDSLRYGAIFIAADEDEDGKNITALVVNFFYRFWPELFEQPFIYKFSTPFVILQKGKKTEYIYTKDYPRFKEDLEKWKGWTITRAKGLCTLKPPDWRYALANPMVTPIMDDGELGETLDLIFDNDRADDRKRWLSDG